MKNPLKLLKFQPKDNSFRRWLKKVFAIDLRALAVFRITLGATILIDLILRARDLVAFYTDDGILPRNFATGGWLNDFSVSLHLMNGTWQVQALLFIVAGLFAIGLILGYRTRTMIVVSWVLLLSLQARNTIILSGADTLLRMATFWAIWLPLGARYSVDSILQRTHQLPKQVATLATAAYLLQIAAVYFTNALAKSGEIWIVEGSGIYRALSLERFDTYLGLLLYHMPGVITWLSRYVHIFWYVGSVMLFSPLWFKYLRPMAAVLFMLTQLGMGLTMQLGIFPLVGIITFIPFLPSEWWDWLAKIKLPSRLNRLQSNWASWWLRNAVKFKASPIKLTLSGWSKLALTCSIAFLILWNTGHYISAARDFTSGALSDIAQTIKLKQRWNMFAPKPTTLDFWYVLRGTLADGRVVDLRTGQYPDIFKPENVAATYKNDRWHKFLSNLRQDNYNGNRLYYARWLCNQWNNSHADGERVETLDLVLVRKPVLPDYAFPELETEILREHICR